MERQQQGDYSKPIEMWVKSTGIDFSDCKQNMNMHSNNDDKGYKVNSSYVTRTYSDAKPNSNENCPFTPSKQAFITYNDMSPSSVTVTNGNNESTRAWISMDKHSSDITKTTSNTTTNTRTRVHSLHSPGMILNMSHSDQIPYTTDSEEMCKLDRFEYD